MGILGDLLYRKQNDPSSGMHSECGFYRKITQNSSQSQGIMFKYCLFLCYRFKIKIFKVCIMYFLNDSLLLVFD